MSHQAESIGYNIRSWIILSETQLVDDSNIACTCSTTNTKSIANYAAYCACGSQEAAVCEGSLSMYLSGILNWRLRFQLSDQLIDVCTHIRGCAEAPICAPEGVEESRLDLLNAHVILLRSPAVLIYLIEEGFGTRKFTLIRTSRLQHAWEYMQG
jgi:hypothetical protein